MPIGAFSIRLFVTATPASAPEFDASPPTSSTPAFGGYWTGDETQSPAEKVIRFESIVTFETRAPLVALVKRNAEVPDSTWTAASGPARRMSFLTIRTP
jgi:hypothetical protein